MSGWTKSPAVKWLEHPSHIDACRRHITHYAHPIIEEVEDYRCKEPEDPSHLGCFTSAWYYHSDNEIDETLWLTEGLAEGLMFE